ncbi:MAG: hypothetical protein HZY79_02560 [Rhodoblastus sp.]|nr:MAG: hypothetical protein HZY79_02560 [Rhodoblastus sp.]
MRLRTLTQVGLRRFELGPRHAVLHELFDGNPPTPIEGRDPDAYTRAFRRAQKLFKATPRVEVVLGRELARSTDGRPTSWRGATIFSPSPEESRSP